MLAKYSNTYSIYHISCQEIGGGLSVSEFFKSQYGKYINYSINKQKEALIKSVIGILRSTFQTDNDYELFNNSILKIISLFEKGNKRPKTNIFSSLILDHYINGKVTDTYVKKRLAYINELLSYTEDHKTDKLVIFEKDSNESTNAKELHLRPYYHFSMNLYIAAYYEAIKQYKSKMASYESKVILAMGDNGQKITKWTNENNLFCTVAKLYPDAIYQYRADWLSRQSLDIFIPSIKIGIEYQGEQHYHPIEYFGGEEKYNDTIKRDSIKAQLCKENNISLIYWKYDEVITITAIEERINDILSNK